MLVTPDKVSGWGRQLPAQRAAADFLGFMRHFTNPEREELIIQHLLFAEH
jgi:hypothetical protein